MGTWWEQFSTHSCIEE